MREQPDAASLLSCAERSLRDDLLPLLGGPQRQVALMIARAMGIALRQLQNGHTPEQQELAEINQLLQDVSASVPLATNIRQANEQLSSWIRGGGSDQGTARNDCHKLLREIMRRRLAESEPKALARDGL